MMRNMLYLAIISFSFHYNSAYACRCVPPSHASAYSMADLVVRATITDVVVAPSSEGSTAILDVAKSWKNSSPARIAAITLTGCSFPWRKDKEYIVFLFREANGIYSTGRCVGNQDISRSEPLLEWLNSNAQLAPVATAIK